MYNKNHFFVLVLMLLFFLPGCSRCTDSRGDVINSIGMEFVYIEPGTFMMGSPEDELGRDDHETLHEVELTQGYYMQTTEVTQGQWAEVMGSNPVIL